LAGDVSFEAAQRFAAGVALPPASGGVAAAAGVPAPPGGDERGGRAGRFLGTAPGWGGGVGVWRGAAPRGGRARGRGGGAGAARGCSRSGLSPAVISSAAAVSGPTPYRSISRGAWAVSVSLIRRVSSLI